ncbi:apolipoprotein N-acyltransferase [Microbacterium sp. SD291]|uniref:apolipoprotein N-acyltransferase n=1 Tax=Microbacterium sp. SD291 TaxID=2782007 RepID=UPI001A96CA56|nr:apolipoprotein N-acyltransferase [Microbacterium sp. SD291]MBO0981888.1 apolipoprotein N-acyltransferase [Microbacterium sp. SD291]
MLSTALSLTDPPVGALPAFRRGVRLPAALLVAAVAGGLLDLSFPEVGWWPLAFVSIALALWVMIGRSIGGAFVVGAAFGAAFYFTHLVWVGTYLGPIPWVALAGLETVLFGVGAIPLALAYRWTDRARGHATLWLVGVPLLIAGLWSVRELVMGSWPYSGFPWARIGMTQANGLLPEAASWVGVTGLSFLIVAACASLVQWWRAGGFQRLRGVLPGAAIMALLVVTPQFPTGDAGWMDIGWVQGNGPSGYFDDRTPGDLLAAQTTATEPLLGQDMDLLVWPEGAVDSDPLANPATALHLTDLVDRAGAPLLANAATARDGDVFNTSMLWEGQRAPQLHDKVNPVPFGEYVPDRWLYERIVPDLIDLIQREYTAGQNPPFVTVDGVQVGLAICFDVIYDSVIWDGARQGAQVYIFQTNNADFRGTDENLQQLAFARMRAIETGRAVVNISTVGTSQVIAPDGQTIDGAEANQTAAAITSVPLREGFTPAVVLGGALTTVIALGAITGFAMAGISHQHFHSSPRSVRGETDA